MDIRHSLYRAASLMGWMRAAAKGPAALLNRFIRVEAYKATGRLLLSILPR